MFETVTVTPTRSAKRLGDVPVSANIVEKETIRQSPAVVADDVLRQVPTFSLFRRSSSLSSHPTAQGVSLRGIGPSGVSRTLVLVDGVPFNDPFGGWVYWTRVPLESVNRIEVIDGSSSSLYGNYGMGGVINIISATPARRSVEFKTQYGNRNSPKADFFASDVWGKLGVAVEGGAFDTDGFPIVIANERGLIDNNAEVDFKNFNVKADYRASDRVSVFFRGGYFKEDRVNGKIGEVNDTKWTAVGGGVRVRMPDDSDLQATVFTDDNTFHSTFLAVTAPSATVAPRSIVRLATDQNGADRRGGHDGAVVARDRPPELLQRRLRLAAAWTATASKISTSPRPACRSCRRRSRRCSRAARLRRHAAQRRSLPAGRVQHEQRRRHAERARGQLEELQRPHLRDLRGHRDCRRPAIAASCPTRTTRSSVRARRRSISSRIACRCGAISAGASARRRSTSSIASSASDSSARWPTRPSVPSVCSAARPASGSKPTRNVSIRSTWYDNRVKNPVSNVTIGTNLQQRQNLGTHAHSRLADRRRDARRLVDARRGGLPVQQREGHRDSPANPALVGLYLPQVPKHRGSVSVAYSNPRYVTLAVSGMFFGRQFDDDLNARTKPGETEPGLPAYGMRGLQRLARHRPQPRRVLRRAEPVRPGVLRAAPADDDRLAAPGQRRRPRALVRPVAGWSWSWLGPSLVLVRGSDRSSTFARVSPGRHEPPDDQPLEESAGQGGRLRRILPAQFRIGRRRRAIRADDPARARLEHHQRAARRRAVRCETVLVSDFLLVQVPGEGWLPFRDVFERDGKQVRDRQERLSTLFLNGSSRSAFDQARAIMDESARYNIGNVSRNINVPTLPLPFLTALHRQRFAFKAGKRDDDDPGAVIEFKETGRPTFITTTGNRDLPVTGGSGWTSATARCCGPSSTPSIPASRRTSW